MEIDPPSLEQSNKQKAEALQALINGPLPSSISKLSSSSRVLPCNEDFHFYNNFEEFKTPVKVISDQSKSMLKSIGFSKNPLGKSFPFPNDSDQSHDWLVDLNDEIYERLDSSLDEFQRIRKKEEETGKSNNLMDEDGFQLVCRKNKKGFSNDMEKEEGKFLSSSSSVKVASRDNRTTGAKPKIPFHIPTIPRPQAEYNIHVNNFNQPFEHVWLNKSEDGCNFIHPLDNLSVLDFVDKSIGDGESVKPLPLESTPFMLVEDVKQLKELAKKLRDVNEFAVDLEHNSYRSFQGMTCLMQISTRTEDFVVDTLKLRVHVGPYLRELFKDPSKKKVMHGADRDILWLQRDFGIYVCNLFDTGQASRVLQLERNSLEFLLHHFCGVTANKEYQNADWRIRPIPDEMLRYAREDTHYLLHMFDLMKVKLRTASTSSEEGEDLLLEVYKRSCIICMQLYEKELLTDTSYLYIYGLQDADFNSQQLAVVAGLCAWRDAVARDEDESTGYILPNKALLEIGRHMPLTVSKLRRLVKSKHQYIEHHLLTVVGVIRNSIQNAYAFEDVAEQLKERTEMASKPYMPVVPDEFEALPSSEDPAEMEAVVTQPEIIKYEVNQKENGVVEREASVVVKEKTSEMVHVNTFHFQQISGEVGDSKEGENSGSAEIKIAEATVQVLKKPNRGFGAFLGNSGSKRKLDPNSKDKAEIKVEQIKSSVTLPFHSFSGMNEQSTSLGGERTEPSDIPTSTEPVPESAEVTKLDEIISFGTDKNNDGTNGSTGLESETDDEPVSLSELSTSFQKCFKPKAETRNTQQVERSQESEVGLAQFKPFDYAAAREESIWFGREGKEKRKESENHDNKNKTDSKERRKKPVMLRMPKEDEVKEFQQARRRQAFPQSGNRSTTFR